LSLAPPRPAAAIDAASGLLASRARLSIMRGLENPLPRGVAMRPMPFRPLALPFALATLASLAVFASCSSSSTASVAAPKPDADAPVEAKSAPARYVYPAAAREEVVDQYHGVKVADPYRWLEDPDAPRTREWIDGENALTKQYLAPIAAREQLRARITELWNYERFGLPFERGGTWFFTKNDGLQNQSVVYAASDLEGEARVLLDPNKLSKDGTVALAGSAVSDDGRFLAYGLAEAGSDWNVWRVRDVASGSDLADTLRWVKFSGASWKADSSGFFYSRYDAPKPGSELAAVNYDQKLYFHRVGDDQSKDELVYARPDHKDWSLHGTVSDDGRWLVIDSGQGTDPRNRVFYKDLASAGATPDTSSEASPEASPESKVIELIGELEASYDFIGSEGSTFWFQTNLDAPRSRVIAIDVEHPERANWKERIAQNDQTLERVTVVGNRFVCRYLRDAHTVVEVHELDGTRVRGVELPGLGTASGFDGRPRDEVTYYGFTSFASPGVIYSYTVATGESHLFKKPTLAFDPSQFETEQVFFASKDGTNVPMFLTYKTGTRRDGDNPTLLYAYGGFNVSITPSFNVARIAWMERGGVFAVANLRGGGEYGEAWHAAGTKLHKQNVFDDFIAAAQWLIDNHCTSSKKLAIQGASNGGLLIGAVLNQRPELFGAALPQVGVMDMLRFEKFTIGWGWASDYGSVANADEFKALRAYSPYHNVREGACYPPTMVTTADHDDRVVPGHSFKYAAALQHAQGCDNPILVRIDTRAGHGAGKPTTKLIDEFADEYAFLVRALGME
jgi:prolyl oligopeptidase